VTGWCEHEHDLRRRRALLDRGRERREIPIAILNSYLQPRQPHPAKNRDTPRLHPTSRQRYLAPLHREQRIPSRAADPRQLTRINRTHQQRPDLQNRRAVLIKRRYLKLTLTHIPQTQPQPTRATTIQPNTTPRKRQRHATPTRRTRKQLYPSMKNRVKQSRVNTKPLSIPRKPLTQTNLNEHLLTTPPHRPHTPKHRPIIKPNLSQTIIQILNTHTLSTHRRPHLTQQPIKPNTHTSIHIHRNKNTTRVTHPPSIPRTTHQPIHQPIHQPRINHQPTTPTTITLTHHNLHLNNITLPKHQRQLKRKLLNHLTTNLTTRHQSQLDERGTRQQNGIEHNMIRKPRMRLQRQPPREQPLIPLTSNTHNPTQQRMTSNPNTRSTQITHHRPHPKPKPLTLKRIPRQINTLSGGVFEGLAPVELCAVCPELSE
jgi:hypothetical protein